MPADPPPLILASQSPRRRMLLREAGYLFEVVPPSPSAECGVCSGESPPELVARLALQKAQDVARQVTAQPTDARVVLACDTVAECQGRVLGKPASRQHAGEMLRLMRGRQHQVFSGLCLRRLSDGDTTVRVEVTRLVMDPVNDQQLESYLDSGQWEGKAGAFGYQDDLDWIHILKGSPSNVVGLPLELLAEMLRTF